jgi:hypothetical protein
MVRSPGLPSSSMRGLSSGNDIQGKITVSTYNDFFYK